MKTKVCAFSFDHNLIFVQKFFKEDILASLGLSCLQKCQIIKINLNILMSLLFPQLQQCFVPRRPSISIKNSQHKPVFQKMISVLKWGKREMYSYPLSFSNIYSFLLKDMLTLDIKPICMQKETIYLRGRTFFWENRTTPDQKLVSLQYGSFPTLHLKTIMLCMC